uniref:Uncharacterized protein TCIL3000_5_10 n=1 Tax=Trypanosoma congolense (strain IL3000) TaxID=1068625 RepID=G0UMB1_TRYCI|nr:unnamed protein product [Trypanosoma congolense IL3000]
MSHGPSGALGHWDLFRSRRTAHCERPRVPTGHPARLCTRSLNDYKKKKKGKSRGVVAAGVAGDLQWGCEFQRQEKERARRNLRQRAPRPKRPRDLTSLASFRQRKDHPLGLRNHCARHPLNERKVSAPPLTATVAAGTDATFELTKKQKQQPCGQKVPPLSLTLTPSYPICGDELGAGVPTGNSNQPQ